MALDSCPSSDLGVRRIVRLCPFATSILSTLSWFLGRTLSKRAHPLECTFLGRAGCANPEGPSARDQVQPKDGAGC